MSKYKLIGWSRTDNNIPEPDILKNITHDKTVYACWEEVLPVNPETGEINLSWGEIAELVDNGTYKDVLKIDNWKYLDLGETYGTVQMEIVAFDADDLADGSGKGPITWISKDLLKGKYRWKDSDKADNSGGYPQSYIKTVVETAITQVVGEDPRPYIESVNKTYTPGSREGSTKSDNFEVWVPSLRELRPDHSGYPFFEQSGPIYSDKFKDFNSLIKNANGTNTATWYWLRTALSLNNTEAIFVHEKNEQITAQTSEAGGVPIGFVTGGTPEERPEGTWRVRFINPSYESDKSKDEVILTVQVKDGEKVTYTGSEPECLIDEFARFIGWFTERPNSPLLDQDEDYEKRYDFSKEVRSDLDLYANYVARPAIT